MQFGFEEAVAAVAAVVVAVAFASTAPSAARAWLGSAAVAAAGVETGLPADGRGYLVVRVQSRLVLLLRHRLHCGS